MDFSPAPPTSLQKLLAEAVGSLVLVITTIGVFGGGSIAAGFALVALMYAFGRLTGGHFNPAVSVGSALAGRTAWKDAVQYVGAQAAGALVAAIILVVLAFGDEGFEFFDTSLGANAYGDEGTGYAFWAAFLMVLFATAVFVLLYLALTDTRNEHLAFAPLGVGLALVGVLSFTANVYSTVNPAQSLFVALFSGSDAIIQVWAFVLGPLLGAAVAGFAYPALFGADREAVPGSGLNFSSGPKAGPSPYAPQQQWGQPGQAGQAGQPGQAAAYGAPEPSAYQQPGGYAAPAAQAPVSPVEQPIIQDGWQWDPQAQQWIPAQQQAPQAPQAPQQGGWPAQGGGEQTQVRPQDGI